MSAAGEEGFLGRWSRLKREEEKKVQEKKNEAVPVEAKGEDVPPPLPPMETLTPQSDFSAFMHPKVQDSLRRVALKKLFADPHFNVEDLNEAYSGDWTGGEPISAELLKHLNQARMHLLSDEERLKLEAEEAAQAQPAPEAPSPQVTQETQETEPDEPGRKDA
jgi:hypothetical protein